MSKANPYKAAGIIAVIYFSLTTFISAPIGLLMVISAEGEESVLRLGLLAIVAPIVGLIASALIIYRGPNKLSLIMFGLLILLLLTALSISFFVLEVGFENTIFVILFAVTGFFFWHTWSMWKYIKNPVSAEIMETFK